MKIYTRKGDGGQTSIWGGRRLSKDDIRVEAIGAVDECNAAVGAAVARGLPAEVADVLTTAQGQLFVVGSELMAADSSGPAKSLPRLRRDDVTWLEQAIDLMAARLPELRNFILPGGSAAAAELHVARGACRRAERRVAALHRAEEVPPAVAAYLNRLADLLFVAARLVNHAEGVPDVVWSAETAAASGASGPAGGGQPSAPSHAPRPPELR